MTLDEKNRARLMIKKAVIVQWLVVVTALLCAGLTGMAVPGTQAILTASTSGLTAVVGLDYFSAPAEGSK